MLASTTTRRSTAAIAAVLTAALVLTCAVSAAFAATTAVERIQVFSQPMGESTMVQIMAAVPSGTSLPATTELIVPAEFKVHAITGFNTADPGTQLDPLEYTTEETDEGELIYTIELTEGDGINLLLNVEGGIYTASESHQMAGLSLLAPADLEEMVYAFAVPAGFVAVGEDLVSFGTSGDGSEVVGQTYENVKKGERPSGLIALRTAPETTEGAAQGGGSLLSGQTLYWILGGAAALVAAGIVVAVLLTRRQIAATDVAFETEGEGEDEGEDAMPVAEAEAEPADEA